MKKNISILMALVLCLAMLFTACGKPTETPAETTSPEAAQPVSAAAKDEIVIAVSTESKTGYDPCTGWGRYGNPLFFSRLLDTDKNLELVNDLATDYECSDDGLTWTFRIRDDVFFTDGEKLTASDVAFTYMTAKTSQSSIDLTSLESAEAVDDTTVKFSLNKLDSTFIYQTSMLGIVPEHCYDENFAFNPIGSGEWKFVEWITGQQVIIERNDDYYGNKPSIKKITMLFLDDDAAFAAIQAGKVDIIRTSMAMADESVSGYHLEKCDTVNNIGLCFAYQQPGATDENGTPIGDSVTCNRAIRQSICYAINRADICTYAINGYGTPAYSLVDGMPWFNSETVIKDNDTAKAIEILEADGWADSDGDGIREKDGLKAEFDVLYTPDCPDRYAMAIAIADTVKEIGIQINLVSTSWDEIRTLWMNTSWMVGGGHYNPSEFMNYSYSKYGGSTNYSYYSNPTVDSYLEQAVASESTEEALEYWKLAQWDGETGCSMLGDAPICWVSNSDDLYFVRDNIDIGAQKPHNHGGSMSFMANTNEWVVK